MKSALFLIICILTGQSLLAQENPTEFKVITVVESIIPSGLGRSRMIENTSSADIDKFTTERNNGKDSDQGKVKRRDIKVDQLNETKMLNFYNLAGINFQNIASNDALIEAKMTALAKDGWKLMQMTSGVESNAGSQDGEGIFITRMVFSR